MCRSRKHFPDYIQNITVSSGVEAVGPSIYFHGFLDSSFPGDGAGDNSVGSDIKSILKYYTYIILKDLSIIHI